MDLTKYSKGKRMVREDLIKEIGENKADLEEIKEVLPKKVTSYIVENITSISGDILSKLKAGDVILKKTGEKYHSYRVSFKKDDEGICLTYTDASLVETVSYDLVGTTWTYNSTDVTPIGEDLYFHNIIFNIVMPEGYTIDNGGKLPLIITSKRDTAYDLNSFKSIIQRKRVYIGNGNNVTYNNTTSRIVNFAFTPSQKVELEDGTSIEATITVDSNTYCNKL